MNFSVKDDVEIPIDQAFAMVTDFDMHRRRAVARGAEMKRLDSLPEVGVGSEWRISFIMRGRQRKLKLTVSELDAPNLIKTFSRSPNVEVEAKIELVPMSRNVTRFMMSIDLTARTLAARLFIQSIRLAKRKLDQRFQKRVSARLRELEVSARTARTS